MIRGQGFEFQWKFMRYIFLTILVAFFLVGCGNEKKEETALTPEESKQLEEAAIQEQRTFWEEYLKGMTPILSAKYGVDEKTVTSMLTDMYIDNLVFLNLQLLERKHIDTYAEKYNVTPKIIASILVDMKLLEREYCE